MTCLWISVSIQPPHSDSSPAPRLRLRLYCQHYLFHRFSRRGFQGQYNLRISILLLAVLCLSFTACTSLPVTTEVPDSSPLSASEAPLPAHIRLTSSLLDFESSADSIFVRFDHGTPALSNESLAGGHGSLAVDGMASKIDIKFSSLISGRSFPAGWTLLGGHLWTNWALDARVVLLNGRGKELASRFIHVPANQWTTCMVDLSEDVVVDSTQILRFELINRSSGCIVRLDNIELIDNQQILVDTLPTDTSPAKGDAAVRPSPSTSDPSFNGWILVRKGYQLLLASPERFHTKLITAEGSAQGWQPLEAGSMRVLFRQVQTNALLCIYRDGRQYQQGELSLLTRDPAAEDLQAEHRSPASISIPEEQGRLDRRTPGDANNDGYNEQRGAYQIVAREVRLNLQITPRTARLVRPVLEISGLPAGDVLVTSEGMLISQTQRLPDGRLLVMLPLTLERPTKISLRLK